MLAILNLSFLLLFSCGLIYCGGNDFIKNGDTGKIIKGVGIIFALAVIWNALYTLMSPKSIMYVLLGLSPSILLSTISVIFIGWAIYCRWSGIEGFLFFLTTIIYALLQLPAYILTFVSNLTDNNYESSLFVALAILKIPYMLLVIGLIIHSDIEGLKLDSPRIYPTSHNEITKPPQWIRKQLRTIALFFKTMAISHLIPQNFVEVFNNIPILSFFK